MEGQREGSNVNFNIELKFHYSVVSVSPHSTNKPNSLEICHMVLQKNQADRKYQVLEPLCPVAMFVN